MSKPRNGAEQDYQQISITGYEGPELLTTRTEGVDVASQNE